jgi:predicted glutamine amidotransferase
MCGIIGAYVQNKPKKVKDKLYNIFISQRDRGLKGGGFTILRKGELIRHRALDPFELFDERMDLKKGDCILFHHRIPTSSANEESSNHPIHNEDDSVAIVHNGHINNYDTVGKTLSKQGHRFETKDSKGSITDSEVVVHLVEGRKPKKAVNVLNSTLIGGYALAWICKETKKINLYRRTNPIQYYADTDGNQYFSSEDPVNPYVTPHITVPVSLDEGALYTLDKDGLKKELQLKLKERKYKIVTNVYDYTPPGKNYNPTDENRFTANGFFPLEGDGTLTKPTRPKRLSDNENAQAKLDALDCHLYKNYGLSVNDIDEGDIVELLSEVKNSKDEIDMSRRIDYIMAEWGFNEFDSDNPHQSMDYTQSNHQSVDDEWHRIYGDC